MRVLITGGTGFIGGALARYLRARGYSVVVFSRTVVNVSSLVELGAEAVHGDIRDAGALERACAGCDAVVHTAGMPRPASWRTFRGVHIEGTKNVIAAAQRAGVRRVVHVASQAVMFSGVDLPRMDESMPYPARYIDPYSATKGEGERIALAANGVGGVEVTSLRPAVVWGRGDTTVLPMMARLARSPMGIPMCGDGSNLEATTHIENLVEAITLALDAPGIGGRAYLVGDAFQISWKEFLGSLVEAAGVRARFTRLPKAIAASGAWLLDSAGGAVGLPVPLARFGVWTSLTSRVIASTRARDELGYTARVGLADGLADLRAWVAEVGGAKALMKGASKRSEMQTARVRIRRAAAP